MPIKVERYNPETKEFEPFRFAGRPDSPLRAEYYYLTEDKVGDPTSVNSNDERYSTAEEARVAGLAALNAMDEGVVSIWKNVTDTEGNGESEVLWEYRRERFGPSRTVEVDLEKEYGE
jgi:hypothetical protein